MTFSWKCEGLWRGVAALFSTWGHLLCLKLFQLNVLLNPLLIHPFSVSDLAGFSSNQLGLNRPLGWEGKHCQGPRSPVAFTEALKNLFFCVLGYLQLIWSKSVFNEHNLPCFNVPAVSPGSHPASVSAELLALTHTVHTAVRLCEWCDMMCAAVFVPLRVKNLTKTVTFTVVRSV